jgi:outer membrane immunogenic protein
MKTAVCVAIAIASIMVGQARAADLEPVPPGPPVAAPPVPYGYYGPTAYGNYNWRGFYFGPNGGYSEGNGASFATTNGLTGSTGNLKGAIAGGQVGYNWQWGNIVAGLEGDAQWSGGQNRSNTPCFTNVCTVTQSVQIGEFATLRARAGVALDGVLLYGTAGGAWTNASANLSANLAGAPALNLSASQFGWTVGFGGEVALMNNWTAKIEYLYIATGTLSGAAPIPANLNGGTVGTVTETAAVRDNIFRIGVNYRFSIY